MLKEWHDFDIEITQKLGDPMLDQNLAAVTANRGVNIINAVTLEYEVYEDDDLIQSSTQCRITGVC
jgi:hypothetical protein